MNKSNFLNPISIASIVCFFAAIIFGIMFSWSKFQEMERTREAIAKTEQELQQKEEYFLALKEDRNKLKGYQEELAKIVSALPDDAELNLLSLFRFLQKTSAETGLILTRIKPFNIFPLEERPEIKKIQFGFQVKGSYASFKAFLVKLEKSARIIKIQDISFSSPEQGELFTFDVIISVHSY